MSMEIGVAIIILLVIVGKLIGLRNKTGSHNDVMCKKAAAGFNFRSGLFNITSRTLCAPI